MANEQNKVKYVPFWKPAKPDPDFRHKSTRHLVKSLEELDHLLNERYKDQDYMSYDIETTGLDPIATDAEIVGYSFSFDTKDGYYVAIAHATGEENLGIEGMQLIYDKMLKVKKVFIANVEFDFPYTEYEGQRKGRNWDMSKVSYYDIFVGIYLADTNVKYPGLKKSAKFYLGWDLDSFEDTLGDAYNFKYVSPQDAYEYGAFDSIMTFALAPISLRFYKEAKLAGKIDNEFLYPMAKMVQGGIKHDLALVTADLEKAEKHYDELEKEIYKMVGYPFKITSPKQLTEALLSIGFDNGIRTKSGFMKGDEDSLMEGYKTNPHPIVKKLIEYKKLGKAISTYIRVIHDLVDGQNKKFGNTYLRYKYNCYSAPTCRLAGGGDKKNPYFAPMNIHAITKPKSKMWYLHDYKPGDRINEGDRVVLDWRFSLVEESDKMVEALDPEQNIRNYYLPDDNSYWVSMDFSAEELRLIANYSNAKVWVETFLSGGDLHENMAKEMWGEENYNHDLRKRAKSMNFGGVYGLSKYSIAQSFNLPQNEADELYEKFWGSIPEVSRFQKQCIARARREGTLYDFFGRPRRVRHWLSSSDRKQISFGERTCKNSPIQSMGASIMKLAMLKVYKNLLNNPKYADHCRFLSTIHDEINMSMEYTDKDLFLEMMHEFYKCMYMKFKGWPVPFEVGIEIGTRWGDSFVFNFTEDGKLVPEWEPAKPKKEAPKVEVKEEPKDEEDEFSFDLNF